MLAYYTTVIKKEEILDKIADDGRNLSTLVNDLACLLKEFKASCELRDVETSQKLLSESEDSLKTIVPILANIRSNFDSYLVSLIPNKEDVKQEQKTEEQDKQQIQTQDPNQLATLLETIKSLKEMKDSLGK